MAKYLVAFVVCLCATGHLSFRWGSLRWAAKYDARRLSRNHENSKNAESFEERLARLSVRELEKKRVKEGTEPFPAWQDARKIADLAQRLERFPTEVLEIAPDPVIKTTSAYITRVLCRGLPGSPDEEFTALFPIKPEPGGGLARYLRKGMRLKLEVEPQEAYGELVRRLPMVDSPGSNSQTGWWVSSFAHEEVLLKRMSCAEREIFARLSPGEVLKSSGVVVTEGGTLPFYFYGSGWSLYKPDAEETILRDEPGSPRRSILKFSRLLKKKGMDLFFVPVPQSASLFPDVALGENDGMALRRPSNNVAVARLLEVLRADGVNVVDLTQFLSSQRFVQCNGVDQPVSRTNDSHWSSVGAMLAAQQIAKSILASGALATLPRLAQEDFEVHSEIHPWQADLNFLLTLKHVGLELPPVPISLFCVTGKSERANLLLDPTSPSADVHLIGDSNCTVYSNLDADLHAHLASSLGMPVHLVAMDGSATLASPNWWLKNFGGAPVKVVVWMVAERFLFDTTWSDF